VDRSFYRFVTIDPCDRRTDRILIARPQLHSMQRGNNSSIKSCWPHL